MGFAELPEEGGTKLSFHTSPRLNRIESPGKKLCAFTFAMVCQADEAEVPLLESLPVLELT
jgi:hypothetical protein